MSLVDSRGPDGEVMVDRSVASGGGKICKTDHEHNKLDGEQQANISTRLPSAFIPNAAKVTNV